MEVDYISQAPLNHLPFSLRADAEGKTKAAHALFISLTRGGTAKRLSGLLRMRLSSPSYISIGNSPGGYKEVIPLLVGRDYGC